MSTLSAVMNATVIHTYKDHHHFSCPPFPLEQCRFSMATVDQEKIFIFANPPLQQGDLVPMDQLQPVHITNAVPNLGVLYYFDRAATIQQPAAVKARGYMPDVPKSPEEIRQITRDLCR